MSKTPRNETLTLNLRDAAQQLMRAPLTNRSQARANMDKLYHVKETNPSSIHQTISHYRIVKKLGEGGMGELYMAQDLILDRTVTIKFLTPELVADEKARKRLIRGAQAAAKLAHQNIRTVYEVGENGREVFLIMEYIDGETLARKLRRQALEVRESVDLAIQLADALAEAHQQGIIHRDVKPENIMLTTRGRLKLLDFGIAKNEPVERSGGTESKTQIRLTQPGVFVGTLHYASPEQLRRKSVDARSDIFNFGLVLFEMLTGKRPFAAGSAAEEAAAVISSEVPALERYAIHVPSELQCIVRKCLEKDPDRRYRSGRGLVGDLKKLKRNSNSFAMRNSHSRKVRSVRVAVHRRRSINSIAVLPMTNAHDNPDAEYLSDGITESLINILSQIPKLRVMARNTVFRYKNKLDDPRQVGSSLGVDAVLAGRVLLRGDNLITSAELVDVADGATLWGQRFSRKLDDILVVQEGMSSEITTSLRLKLTGEERKRLKRRYTENPEAYQHYLKGRFFWNRRTQEGLRKGIHHFELAIEADPSYALAYAGLADSYNMLCWWNVIAPQEGLPNAKAAALKAIELDATLAEAHASAAAISETDWDWKTAEREYKCALELNPNYASAHQWYAEFLAHIAQFDQALVEMKLAERLDPLSNIINTEVGWILSLAGEYESAIEKYTSAVELDPELPAAHWRLSEAYLQKKMFDEALGEIQRAIKLSCNSPQMLARLAYAYAVSNKRYKAFGVLNDLSQSAKLRYVSPYDIAIVYAGLREKEMALASLEQAYKERAVGLTFLKVEPAFNSLRDDPRFKDVMNRVGLVVDKSASGCYRLDAPAHDAQRDTESDGKRGGIEEPKIRVSRFEKT